MSNIVTFPGRYEPVATFEITTNRRSRPQIIEVANQFGRTIPERIDKTMAPHRPPGDRPGAEVVAWSAPTEVAEAGWIASLILDLADQAVRYRDIAVLVRGRAAYPRLVEQFATFGIPVQPGGRTGLFDQPEAVVLGPTFAWLSDIEWHDRFGPSALISDSVLFAEYQRVFEVPDGTRTRVVRFLREWKTAVPGTDRRANLMAEFYELLDELQVRSWSLIDPLSVNSLGTLARFSALLVDYESVRLRARPDLTCPASNSAAKTRQVQSRTSRQKGLAAPCGQTTPAAIATAPAHRYHAGDGHFRPAAPGQLLAGSPGPCRT